MTVHVPMVIQKTQRGEMVYDIPSRLLRERIIFLNGEIDDDVAASIQCQLLFLDSESPKDDIHLYINSPGGLVSAGMGIYDLMQIVRADIHTYCLGQAASMAAILLSSGTKGKRHILPSARVMIHQPSGGAKGMSSDVEIWANELKRQKQTLTETLARNTGKEVEDVARDIERDRFLSAEEAVSYGIVDSILRRKS